MISVWRAVCLRCATFWPGERRAHLPGEILPCCSKSRIIPTASRSLTLHTGFKYSSFTATCKHTDDVRLFGKGEPLKADQQNPS